MMKIFILNILIFLLPIISFGQNLNECGVDDNPILTLNEAEFLSIYMNDDQKKECDFVNKKVVFVTGESASRIGSKSDYFEEIRDRNETEGKISTHIIEFNENEKAKSGGYDIIITYWVKLLTNRKKRIIIRKLSRGKKK